MFLELASYILPATIGAILSVVLIFGLTFALTSKRIPDDGLLQYYFYAILIAAAAAALFTNREFHAGNVFIETIHQSVIAEWSTRFASLFIMFAALERSIHFFKQNNWNTSRLIMLGVLVYFWITNLFIPTFITAGNNLELKHFYSLALSIGIALSLFIKPDTMIYHARNALVFFVLASLAFIFINPFSALDLNYSQGYIPGLPRFYGLAPHATTMGMITVLALWLSIAYPYEKSKWQLSVLLLCFLALVLAQSKTVFASFIIGVLFIVYYHAKTSTSSTHANLHKLVINSYAFIAFMLVLIFILLALSDYESLIYKYISPTTLHNLTTFTGRDVIWEIALTEFHKSPILGYGMNLFSESFKESIGMINATDGHSQYIDTLGRSGIVGFSGLLLLYTYMIYYSVRLAKKTHGLSLTLITFILINSVTAVTIGLTSIGIAWLNYYLLLYLISVHLTDTISSEQSTEVKV